MNASPQPSRIVVMGVSAVGKSTIGRLLADELSLPFLDADDLHTPASVEKMRSGIALTDADRLPWLVECGRALAGSAGGAVIACSALTRAYRDTLRTEAPDAWFVHLHADPVHLQERAAQRTGHFMPPSLLASQLATLEPLAADERGMTVDAVRPPDALVAAIAAELGGRTADG